MRKYKFFIILFICGFIFFHNSFFSSASSVDGIDVNLKVGSCNNDGICQTGEDLFNCPLDCTPVVPPITNTINGGSISPDTIFKDLTVEVSYDSAVIKWKTSLPTISNLKWGTDTDYKDGIIKDADFLLDHKVELTNLKDGTIYYFSIEAVNLLGKINLLENQIFRTLSLPDTIPPENLTDVNINSTLDGVLISWKNPPDIDFDYVRVLKNSERYLGSPFLGSVVYEGKGSYFTDANVVDGNKYFYSIFSRDRIGNYSSGSLINIIYNKTGKDTWGDKLTSIEKVEPIPNISYNTTQALTVYDFKLGGVLNFSADEPIDIKTNYFPSTKNDDMWVEIRDSDGRIVGQYFFFREKDKDGFTSVRIPPLEKSEVYGITIYRYSNNMIYIVHNGIFQIKKIGGESQYNYYWSILWYISLVIIIILILLGLYLIFRRFLKHK